MKVMYFINKDKKIISKEIPKNLISLYLNIGWTFEKPLEKEESKIKQEKKSK